MTVIMGHKTANKMYLGADNRLCTPDDELICDNDNKIVVVNDKVAVAFAGYGGVKTIFENMIKDNTKEIYVEDVIRIFKFIYWTLRIMKNNNASKNTFHYGARFIIAGKSKKNKYCIYTMSILNGKIEKPSMVNSFMFPPSDADTKECCEIYSKYTKADDSNFIQNTIKDISKISKVISSSGDIWTCDITTGESSLKHFE